jgi:hypothetical protein
VRVVLPAGVAGARVTLGAVSPAVRPADWTVARAAVTVEVKLLSGPPDRETKIVAVAETPTPVLIAVVLEAMLKLPIELPSS